MDDLYELLLQRNAIETIPFVSVYDANATLLNQLDSLQRKYDAADRELSLLRQQFQDVSITAGTQPASSNHLNAAATAALKNEKRLRDKLEKLQEELHAKLKNESEDRAMALKTTQELSEMKDLTAMQEKNIASLKEEKERMERAIEHLTAELESAKSDRRLAEQQYEGLKTTIRSLQEENDKLHKENRQLSERVVTEKGKMVDEMTSLTDTVESLKKEVEMLRAYKAQELKQKSWNIFGLGSPSKILEGVIEKIDVTAADGSSKAAEPKPDDNSRKWGTLDVVMPSSPKHTVHAHAKEGVSLKYDASGSDLLATAGVDSTVKIWDTSSGTLRATLHGTMGHPILCCDIDGNLAVGAGSDKTCRVWNIRTNRMLHHLVGHQNKITCLQLFDNGHFVITGSADRSLKVWDISRTTYRQTTTLRHSSTANCLEAGPDSNAVVSGHMDGGLRFWDTRSGHRVAELQGMHEGGVTSVQFNPANNVQVLTNGLDSCIKLTDIRTGAAIHTLRHANFQTSQSWSRSVLSPDGKYAAAGSNMNGHVFVWDIQTGSLKKMLEGHMAGVCGIDWSRGGSSGQQVASLDRKGNLILWA